MCRSRSTRIDISRPQHAIRLLVSSERLLIAATQLPRTRAMRASVRTGQQAPGLDPEQNRTL